MKKFYQNIMSQKKRMGLLHAVVEPQEYFKCPSFMEFAVKTPYP